MLVKEITEKGLVHHYSDANKYIRQKETGIEYSDAIDIDPCPYTYEEIDKEIEELSGDGTL